MLIEENLQGLRDCVNILKGVLNGTKIHPDYASETLKRLRRVIRLDVKERQGKLF